MRALIEAQELEKIEHKLDALASTSEARVIYDGNPPANQLVITWH